MFTKTRLNRGCNYPQESESQHSWAWWGARWDILGGKSCFHLRTRLESSRFTRPDDLEAGHTSSSPAKICTISIKDRVQWSKKKKLRFFRLIDPVGEVFFFKTLDLQPLRASWWQLRQPEWSDWSGCWNGPLLPRELATQQASNAETSSQINSCSKATKGNQKQPISDLHRLRPKAMNTHWRLIVSIFFQIFLTLKSLSLWERRNTKSQIWFKSGWLGPPALLALLKWTASTKRTSDPTSVQCRNKQSDKFMLQSNQRQPKATNIWSTSFET